MLASAGGLSSRTLLIWGVGAIVALWLALTAVSGATQAVAPGIALVAFPRSGFAYEARAADHAIKPDSSIQKMRISDADLDDARAALRREPFATDALTLIGLAKGQQGDTDGATRIVAAVHAMNKRQLLANAWLINRYGAMGRARDTLALLDEALKIQPELTARYMPAFAQALQNPETIPAFQTMLVSHPAWESAFWDAAAGNKASLPNAEFLRGRILAGPEKLGPTDTMLVAAFIAAGRVDLALNYGKSLPSIADDRDNLVRNATFSYIPVLPPVDWELINDGRIGAAIDESRGTLEVNAQPGASGTVARQLIALSPGNYALLIKLGQQDVARGSEISVQLRCAETGKTDDVVTERLTGDLNRSFAIAENGCRYFWLNLDFSALDSSEPALSSIAEVRITPGRALP